MPTIELPVRIDIILVELTKLVHAMQVAHVHRIQNAPTRTRAHIINTPDSPRMNEGAQARCVCQAYPNTLVLHRGFEEWPKITAKPRMIVAKRKTNAKIRTLLHRFHPEAARSPVASSVA